MKMKERIIYLDLLRTVSVFAVIFLHVCSYCWYKTSPSSFEWQVFNFYDCLVRFCVPVFVMISGAFFLDVNRNVTYKRLLTHNIPRIIVAFLFWSVAYAISFPLADRIVNKKNLVISELLENIVYGHYHLWFLFIIVGLYFITPFLRPIVKDKRLEKQFIVVSLLLCYGINLINLIPGAGAFCYYVSRFDINLFSGYVGYFVLGHYLNRNEMSKKIRRGIYLLAVISLTLTIGVTSIWSVSTGIPQDGLYEYLLPNTFIVSVALFEFVKKINIPQDSTARKIVSKLAALSFGMYLVHDFFNVVFTIIGFTTTLFNPIFSVPLISLCVYVGSLMVALIISRIPILNRWIM